jgi:hypothetical protein
VIEVTRFHALTERARYTIGGQHEIEFVYVRPPRGDRRDPGRARGGRPDLPRLWRPAAVEAEQQGITQRVRITERLVGWVQGTFPVTGVARPPAT